MANDPNAAIASLNTDLSAISTDYDPQIKAQRTAAEGLESKSVQSMESYSQEAERAAQAAISDEGQIKAWADSTPTRQAVYANAMHTAPILAVLTALGGRLTKLNGQQMLAATTGIVQGVNAGSEKKYEDAYNAWMSSYQKIKDHHARMMEYYRLMLDAYAGRADAPQKAAEAARRMAGDLLDEKQMKLTDRVNTFKATQAALDRADRVKISLTMMHDKVRHELKQEERWKEIEKRAAASDPATKAKLAAAKQRWLNAKTQIDELLRQRGQINSNLTLSADAQAQLTQHLDDEVAAQRMTMDQATSESEAVASAAPATGPAPAPRQPPQAQPVKPANLSPGKLEALKKQPGKALTFADGTVAVMKADGSVEILAQGGATVH
jgi:hypothetical protein